MAIERKAVTKKEAATAQLGTAIKLYFEHRDLISAYTLCVAADGILEGIYKNKRREILKQHRDKLKNSEDFRFSWAEEWEIRIKPEHKKEAFQLFNKAQNFFKHADKDHEEILEFADVELTGIRIFTTIANFRLVFQEYTPAMNVFFMWFVTLRPQILKDGNPLKAIIVGNPISEKLSERFSPAELAAIGYANLLRACPDLFPPSDLMCKIEAPRSRSPRGAP